MGNRWRLGVSTELAFASCVVLVQELMLIRWMPSQVRVLAYFPNVVLISAFLGLGLGALLAKRKQLLWLWPISLVFTVMLSLALSRVAFTHESESEHLWLLYYDLPKNIILIKSVRLPIILMFIVNALTFLPLGQFVAKRLQDFGQQSKALWGYCWDLLGSLVGVIIFAIMSWYGFYPYVWFTVCLLLGLVVFAGQKRLIILAVCSMVIVGLVYINERADMYSPYYALNVSVKEGSVEVMTNGSLHQIALPLGSSDPLSLARVGYHKPYDLLEKTPKNALVLGSGTGNDVAVLLDRGVEQIDAVEIDPLIIEIGRKHHPNQPYDSNRVHLYNTDARSYLNTCRKSYDIIVFGTLDSMTRLSALSSVRLDNFVYTKECIQAARRLMNPDGGMVLYFMVGSGFIDRHLQGIISQAFGAYPRVEAKHYMLFNRVYMAGEAFGVKSHVASDSLLSRALVPSDNWPFLYLEKPGLSQFYLALIISFLLISFLGVAASSKELRKNLIRRGGIDLEMFLFGAAFLLIETKLVTEMSLAWGATWITSAVVFGAILAMILLATAMTQLKNISLRVAFTGLVATLLLTYFTPVDVLLTDHTSLRLLGSMLYAGSPIFFASICFAARFKTRTNTDLAFGWNLLGAVVGGLLEFSSMVFGLKAMTLLAVAIYLCIVVKIWVGDGHSKSVETVVTEH